LGIGIDHFDTHFQYRMLYQHAQDHSQLFSSPHHTPIKREPCPFPFHLVEVFFVAFAFQFSPF
jgi:hypothetical protein